MMIAYSASKYVVLCSKSKRARPRSRGACNSKLDNMEKQKRGQKHKLSIAALIGALLNSLQDYYYFLYVYLCIIQCAPHLPRYKILPCSPNRL